MKVLLLTHNYDYFDFLHTLLPTELPLKTFYEELYQLYRYAIPLPKQFELARHFRLLEPPPLLLKSARTYGRLRRAYLDYPAPLQVA